MPFPDELWNEPDEELDEGLDGETRAQITTLALQNLKLNKIIELLEEIARGMRFSRLQQPQPPRPPSYSWPHGPQPPRPGYNPRIARRMTRMTA